MASNKRFLKAYARFDGSGRIVASSTILRKNKPKVGNWKEVQTYLCCNGVELFFTPASFPIVSPRVSLYCNEVLIDDPSAFTLTATDLASLAEILNNEGGTAAFGYYAAQSDGSIKLTVPNSVKDELCPTGTLSFTVTPD
jgi:hypothetical protein